MRRLLTGLLLLGSVALTDAAVGAVVVAQSSLTEAAERARRAWLAHDPQRLVGQSGSVVLEIPGADPSSPLARAQAAELLRRHWRTAVERSFTVAAVREIEAGKGHVELDRRHVVFGTSDERRETVFLAFRRAEGDWWLVEARRAP